MAKRHEEQRRIGIDSQPRELLELSSICMVALVHDDPNSRSRYLKYPKNGCAD
jgi:hypothetical protein